jgi:hypothetical protein
LKRRGAAVEIAGSYSKIPFDILHEPAAFGLQLLSDEYGSEIGAARPSSESDPSAWVRRSPAPR